jgi:hypothetical protein
MVVNSEKIEIVEIPRGKAIFEKYGFTAYPNEKYGD